MEYEIARRAPRYQFEADVEVNGLGVGIRFVARRFPEPLTGD